MVLFYSSKKDFEIESRPSEHVLSYSLKGKKERKMANTWIFLPRVKQGFAPDIHFLVFSLFIPKRVQPVSFQNYYSDVDKTLRKGVVAQNNLLKVHPLFYRFL